MNLGFLLSAACLQSVADIKFIVSQNSPEIWTEGAKYWIQVGKFNKVQVSFDF